MLTIRAIHSTFVAPPTFGVLMDLMGRRTLFAVAVLCFLGAWNFVRKVRRGEGAQATPIVEAIPADIIDGWQKRQPFR